MDFEKHLKSEHRVDEKYGSPDDASEAMWKYWDTIIKPIWKSYKIGNWVFDIQGMTGNWAFYLKGDDRYQVFCTPFWEGAEGVKVDIYDDETGDYEDLGTYPIAATGNAKKDIATFTKLMKRILAPIEKRIK